MDTKDKLVTLEDLKVVHDGVEALETRMESAESEISDTVKKSTGGTFKGTVRVNREDGTTSETGTSSFWVGNSTPTGTAGNSKGQVVIYGNGANYVNIQASNATGNRTVELPDASGTIALEAQTGASGNSQYTKFPDGTLMQWGLAGQYVSSNRADVEITMPLAFVNSSYSVFANGEIGDDANNYEVLIVIRRDNAQKFTAHIRNATGNYIRQFNWLAIGRWK